MKKFIGLVLFATLSFVGIGGLIDQVGAKYRSDEKALAILQRARQAIGGESALSGVKSMTITGKSTKTFDSEGARVETGDVEINIELPGRMSKVLKFANGNGDMMSEGNVNVIVMKKGGGDTVQWRSEGGDEIKADAVKRVIIKKDDGTEEVVTEDVKPVIVRKVDGNGTVFTTKDNKSIEIRGGADPVAGAGGNSLELFRTTLSLLLTAPEGVDVSYTYAGESSVDGFPVDVINASINGGGVKLFLDKSNGLPRMMTFKSAKPVIAFFRKSGDAKTDPAADLKVLERKTDAPEAVDIEVKYSDFRSVNGILLPFRWTQTANGRADETVEVTNYEINPSNISDKFKDISTKVLVRTNKDK